MRQRRIYNNTMEPVDQWLESQGLFRKHTARDASCLFRAVSEQLVVLFGNFVFHLMVAIAMILLLCLFHSDVRMVIKNCPKKSIDLIFLTQIVYAKVRQLCLNFTKTYKNLFKGLTDEALDDHIERMKNPNECGNLVELQAISVMFRCKILVFKEVEKNPEVIASDFCNRTIMLCLSSNDHYDSVYTKQCVANAAFCQSIVYGLLYEEVFHMQDVAFAVETMLHSKPYRMRRDSCLSTRDALLHCGWFGSLNMSECERDVDDGNIDVRGLLSMGCTPFPYKVAKALDPEIYRNIEFDAWNDIRRELRMGLYDPSELRVGVKCLVKLSKFSKQCYAHIQEMAPDQGPVLIFVEELGEKCTVPYESLEPLVKDNSSSQWMPPYRNRCRGLANVRRVSISVSDSGERWKRMRSLRPRKTKTAQPGTDTSESCGNNPKRDTPRAYMRSFSARFAEEQSDCSQPMPVPVILEQSSSSPPPQPDSSTPGTYVEPQASAAHCDGTQSMLTYPAYVPPAVPVRPVQYLGGRTLGDSHGSVLYQEVNLLAQKSLHLDGSDLPLTDIPTLRFFYNLGLDYHHMNGNQVMGVPLQAVPIPAASSCQVEEQFSRNSQKKQPLPDSTTCSDEETYQPSEHASSRHSVAASPAPPHVDREVVPSWPGECKMLTTVQGMLPPRLQCPGENVPYYYTVEAELLQMSPQCYQQYVTGQPFSYAATNGSSSSNSQGYSQMVMEPPAVEGNYVAAYPSVMFPQGPTVYTPHWVQMASPPQGTPNYPPVPG